MTPDDERELLDRVRGIQVKVDFTANLVQIAVSVALVIWLSSVIPNTNEYRLFFIFGVWVALKFAMALILRFSYRSNGISLRPRSDG